MKCPACGRTIIGKPSVLSVFGEKMQFCADSGGCRRTTAENNIMEREMLARKPKRRANS
jgi:ribosome-binding protein aMBF1 (putative translation factor)